MPENNNVVQNLRAQLKGAHDWLEGTLQGVDDQIANAVPTGKVAKIGAQYAHVVSFEDMVFNAALKGGAPLMMSMSAGIDSPPPMGPWDEWGRTVKVNFAEQQAYAQKIYEVVDSYLATIDDSALTREIDLQFTKLPLGRLLGLLILNAFVHAGEISCLKGLNGMKGYPQ